MLYHSYSKPARGDPPSYHRRCRLLRVCPIHEKGLVSVSENMGRRHLAHIVYNGVCVAWGQRFPCSTSNCVSHDLESNTLAWTHRPCTLWRGWIKRCEGVLKFQILCVILAMDTFKRIFFLFLNVLQMIWGHNIMTIFKSLFFKSDHDWIVLMHFDKHWSRYHTYIRWWHKTCQHETIR